VKKFVSLACLALTLALPVAAAESVRFPPISPDKFTPQQKEFADLLQKSPRNGNVNNPPFEVYFRIISAARNSVWKPSTCPIICVGARAMTQGRPNSSSSLPRANGKAATSGTRIMRWG
jgi:hypothetical protein